MYRIFIVATLCVALTFAQTDQNCTMVVYTENYGFYSTGPVGGEFISEFINKVDNSLDCNQQCCDQAASPKENEPQCKAAWFFNNTASNQTVCQLWSCTDCMNASNFIDYAAQYKSRVGFMMTEDEDEDDDEQVGEAEGESETVEGYPELSQGQVVDSQGYPLPSQGQLVDQQGYPLPNQGQAVDSQGYPLPAQGQAVDSQGYPLPSQGQAVDSQGYPLPTNQGYPVDNQAYPQGYPESAPINPQTGYTDQQLPSDGSNPYDTVDTSPNQQGTYVYNPATGEYTLQNAAPVDGTQLPENVQPGYDQYPDGQQQLIPGQENLPGYPELTDPALSAPASSSDVYESVNGTSATNSTEEKDDDDGGWGWWSSLFGNGDDEDEEEEEEDYEEEMKEWEEEEEEWEKEEEEWEKEHEEEWDDDEDEDRMYTSTTPSEYVTDSYEGEIKNDGDGEDDDEWFENLMGDNDDDDEDFDDNDVEHIYSTPRPKEAEENLVGDADNYYRPETFDDSEDEDDWGADYVNAPVIAVGACAAVVLVLLLLVFVGRKMTGKTERAQYKPLKESFSGSSTYHEDI